MWPIATYPCDSLMTINAKYSFEVDLRNANICKTKVAKPLNTVAQCSAHNTDAKYWKKDNVFDQIKTNFQGVCLSPLVQGVDTNIFDGFGKEKYQRIICCQGKEGVGGATKRWNMQQWMQERGGRPLSLCSTHLRVANARDKRIFHGKTPLSDWLVDTLRFSGVDHFCFLQFATQKTARERCWACATSLTQTSPCPTRWSLSTTPYHQLDLWRTLESQSTTIVWKYTFKDTHHHQHISNIQSTILLLTAYFYSSTDDKVQLCRWQEYNCDCQSCRLFVASAPFLPTTDELCNLARGASARNVQLDLITKSARMLQLKAAPSSTARWPCVCLRGSAASVVCPQPALFGDHTFGFRPKSASHRKFSYFAAVVVGFNWINSKVGACGGNFWNWGVRQL